jgi:hypothetical protein
MRSRAIVSAIVVALVALTVALAACGGDPYTGTWTSPTAGTFTIKSANEGWWSIDNGTKDMPHVFYAAEINGELQTPNGRNTFKISGDKLEVTMVPGEPATEFTRR